MVDPTPIDNQRWSPHGWHHVDGDLMLLGTDEPTLTQMSTSGMYGYVFTAGDKIQTTLRVPHDVVKDQTTTGPTTHSPLYFHCHWTTSGSESGSLTWRFRVAPARRYDANGWGNAQDCYFDWAGITQIDVAEATSGGSATYQPDGVYSWGHYASETPGQRFTVPVSANESIMEFGVDALAIVTIELLSTSLTTDDIFLLHAGMHYFSTESATSDRGYPYWWYAA